MVLDALQIQDPALAARYAGNRGGAWARQGTPILGLPDLTESLRETKSGAGREQLVQDFVAHLVQRHQETTAKNNAPRTVKPPQPELIVPRIMMPRDINDEDAKPWRKNQGVSTTLTDAFQVHWGIWEERFSNNHVFTPGCLERSVGHSACDRRETISAGLANLPAMTAGLHPERLQGGRIQMVMGADAWTFLCRTPSGRIRRRRGSWRPSPVPT
ncbi:hypothetical protein [Pseudogemmobacter bohemicus]|uniref:hypothetical protein n=1 Tax=Pseudogemmobacter bohemicus TaxID=2250708 RepID=UPI001E4DDA25|nr:hypothetical protein [Pseudogemmobacter bohemicus]